MREIKFRAFCKRSKRMFPVLEMIFDEQMIRTDDDEYSVYNMNNFYIMQYTGLKDKNNKEIYEGDVVKAINMSHNKDLPCEWTGKITQGKFNGCWQITKKIILGYSGEPEAPITQKQSIPIFNFMNFNCGIIPDMNLEVIGNIYENEDLL